ncbi:transposase [Methylococcus sp. EFPC2]|nr:transposase [Methylococcus sp. EFPC2]
MALKLKTLDELMKDCKTPQDVDALYSQLLHRLINRSLDAEMDAHLGYEGHAKNEPGQRRGNTRNGKASKTVKGAFGELEIETPRDRQGSFEPLLVVDSTGGCNGLVKSLCWRFVV